MHFGQTLSFVLCLYELLLIYVVFIYLKLSCYVNNLTNDSVTNSGNPLGSILTEPIICISTIVILNWKKYNEQAGAELCQAQEKLVLANKLMSSFTFLKIRVVFLEECFGMTYFTLFDNTVSEK